MGRVTAKKTESAVAGGREIASLSGLSRSVDAFGRTIDHLQAEYEALEQRHAALNGELASANEQLQTTLHANRRLTAFLDRVLESVPAGFITVDARGVIRFFNPAAAALLRRRPEEVVGRRYHDVWPERSGEEATAAACASGQPAVEGARREVERPDGPPLVLSVSTAVIPVGLDAEPQGALEVFQDVSVFLALHDEVARMRTLAALGEMAATVAHEIRNPLGGMIGFAELLERRCRGEGEREEMAGKILTGARNLNDVVERMLELARDPRIAPRPLDWPEFLKLTLDQYEETARRRGVSLTLVRRFPERLPPGRADALCLRQALWNVLENAEQAAGADGTIEFSAEATASGGIRIHVADSGPGVDPEVADRVFLPFVTTRENGTGLGLAMARKIVEAHGGRISIHNGESGGARVCFDLPLFPEKPEDPAAHGRTGG